MYENRQAYVSHLNDTMYEGKKVYMRQPNPFLPPANEHLFQETGKYAQQTLIFVGNKKLEKGPYRDYPINATYPSWQLFSYLNCL